MGKQTHLRSRPEAAEPGPPLLEVDRRLVTHPAEGVVRDAPHVRVCIAEILEVFPQVIRPQLPCATTGQLHHLIDRRTAALRGSGTQ